MAMSEEEIQNLNENLKQLNDTIKLMNDTMSAVTNQSTLAANATSKLKASVNNTVDDIDDLAGSTINAKGALDNLEKSGKKADERFDMIRDGLLTLSNVIGKSGTALDQFGSALINSQRSATKYNSAIDSGVDAVSSLVGAIKFIGKPLAALAKIFGVVAQGATQQFDNLVAATDQLKKMGAAGEFNTEQFLNLANSAGIASNNLDILVKPIRSMGPALLALGNNTGQGAVAFTKLIAVTDEERMRLRRLGIDQESMIESQAAFVRLQQMAGVNISARYKTETQLQKASLDYVRNLQDLAALSGIDVEEARKRQEAALNDFRFQSNLIAMERRAAALEKGSPEDKARAEEIRNTITRYVDGINQAVKAGPLMANAAKTLLNTQGNLTDSTSFLATMGVDYRKFYEEMTSGDPQAMDNFIEDTLDAIGAQIERFGGTVAYLDDATASQLGINQELVDLYNQRRRLEGTEAERTAAQAAYRERAEREGFDAIADGRAALTNAEIKAGTALDQVLFPATETLASGFKRLNDMAISLSDNIDVILGYIPGYESKTELQGDITSEQQNIERYQQQLDAANDTLRNVTYSNRIEKYFTEQDRDEAERQIQNSLTRQLEQVVKLIDKGEDVDPNILNQAMKEAERQLAESETALSNPFITSDPEKLAAAETGVRVNREELNMIMAKMASSNVALPNARAQQQVPTPENAPTVTPEGSATSTPTPVSSVISPATNNIAVADQVQSTNILLSRAIAVLENIESLQSRQLNMSMTG
jgi:uncharacterized protein YoxC